MSAIINCHTHVFTNKCVPDRFIGIPFLGRLLSNGYISYRLAILMDDVIPTQTDFLSKYAGMLRYGADAWQELIFENLIKKYPADTKFVLLTMDMDFMDAGTAVRKFPTQLDEMADLKRKHPNQALPFICIEPRRGTADANLALAKKYIENKGFNGIKLYPPLGFYPFDEKLEKVYEYAEKNSIPLLAHCSKQGGIYFRGKLTPEMLNPGHGLSFAEDKMKNFRDNFMNPSLYEIVLRKFPDLKICFAHYGGKEEIQNFSSGKKDTWYGIIKDLMVKYPNVYADISYTLSTKEIHSAIRDDIRNPAIRDRILFGTDFYMTEKEKKEEVLKEEFRKCIGEDDFAKISNANCKKYLRSDFFPIQ